MKSAKHNIEEEDEGCCKSEEKKKRKKRKQIVKGEKNNVGGEVKGEMVRW